MKQAAFSMAGFDRYTKTAKRAAILAEVDDVVSWAALCVLVEPFYPASKTGLLHGGERGAWGGLAYQGQSKVIKEKAPEARGRTNRRYRHRGVVNEAKRLLTAWRACTFFDVDPEPHRIRCAHIHGKPESIQEISCENAVQNQIDPAKSSYAEFP